MGLVFLGCFGKCWHRLSFEDLGCERKGSGGKVLDKDSGSEKSFGFLMEKAWSVRTGLLRNILPNYFLFTEIILISKLHVISS